MMATIKQYFVWILLAFTLLATLWVAVQGDENADSEDSALTNPKADGGHHFNVTRPVPVALQPAKKTLTKDAATQVPWSRPTAFEEPKNIFTAYVSAAQLAEQTAAVAQPPQMPSAPYVYAGKLKDAGEVIVFLTGQYKNYTVKLGDTLDETWQVQAITPPTMTLKYLPLNTETTMNIGALL